MNAYVKICTLAIKTQRLRIKPSKIEHNCTKKAVGKYFLTAFLKNLEIYPNLLIRDNLIRYFEYQLFRNKALPF